MELHNTAKSVLDMFLEDPRTTNLCLYDKQRYSLHVAVIVSRGKVLAYAMNKNGTRSRGSGYSTHSIHAEKNVVKELGDISKLRGADMYVMRISKDQSREGFDKFSCSKPCCDCEKFLTKCMREYGLKRVYYTS